MGHVARIGGRAHSEFWWENLRERDDVVDLRVDGRIFKWVFKKWDGGYGLNRSDSE